MKRIIFRGMLVLAMALSLGAFAADDAPAAPAPADAAAAPAPEAEKPLAVTVTGANYCLIAAYGGDAAKPAPNAQGFKNALKVATVAGADGKEIAGLAGKTLHYLPTEAAAPLSAGEENVGKTVTVKGQLYQDAGVIVVESFEAKAGDALEEDWEPLPTGTLSGQQVL